MRPDGQIPEKIVLANWKASLSPAAAARWLDAFAGRYRPSTRLRVVLAIPFLMLVEARARRGELPGVVLAAQDVSPFPQGSYTGATPADWLRGLVDYVLVGHRERRRYFHESNQDAANKVSEVLAAELTPILCAGREGLAGQLAALETAELEKTILACTPEEAEALELGRNIAAVADAARYFAKMTGGRPVLYGGGVHYSNVAELIVLPELAGVMVAGGSLDPAAFAVLLANAEQALTSGA
ncbi:MAG: triose-phosphate isomerase [Desulfobulbaceae bacterium]|jgi:triosephosphate isomerase